MSDENRFEAEILMPAEFITVRVSVDAHFIRLEFDTASSLMLSFLFEERSADEVRRVAHALLEASDTLAPPSRN